ncbi:MAG: hypothetical protein KDJ20_10510 [Hyphomicrobiales bacterium]|nr:hypothetical protein [Hyphomicrobiales bacterium]MCC2104417.1 hypothetical protein [Hyphomicrobiales bacterium]MCC2108780.1 hypothetical protein [Hyphomicrobiales bacterium]
MKAANNHLTRVGLLADTEWKVSLAYWAASLALGAGAINLVSSNKEMASAIFDTRLLILIALSLNVFIFVFGFSVNQSRSIATERNRFIYFQNLALRIANIDDANSQLSLTARDKERATRGPLKTISEIEAKLSIVWAMKFAASTFFSVGLWTTLMILVTPKSGFQLWSFSSIVSCIFLLVWIGYVVFCYRKARSVER